MSCLLERRSFLVVPILLVAACAGWEPETEAERELRLSRERLQSTVGQGGLTGAAGGALLGALVGGAGGAFQGAEIGRLAGAAAGAYVRQLQAEYASQEAVMVQVAADLRATNAEMQRSIDAMRAVLAQTRAAGEEDVVRRNRNAAEAEEAVAAATAQQRFYIAAAQVLSDDGASVASSPVAPELRRLSERLQTMRSISEDLAG